MYKRQGTTVTNGADSTATTAASTRVTNANGNTKYAADGVRINTTGKNPVSLTDAGLDNGNNVIKNVASGHVNLSLIHIYNWCRNR